MAGLSFVLNHIWASISWPTLSLACSSFSPLLCCNITFSYTTLLPLCPTPLSLSLPLCVYSLLIFDKQQTRLYKKLMHCSIKPLLSLLLAFSNHIKEDRKGIWVSDHSLLVLMQWKMKIGWDNNKNER